MKDARAKTIEEIKGDDFIGQVSTDASKSLREPHDEARKLFK